MIRSANKFLFFSVLCFFVSDSLFAQNDSLFLFSFSDFFGLVKQNHPLAQQAALRPKSGEAALLKARGNFDPVAGADLNQKYFDDKKYFSLLNSALKIPTWFGAELKTGYEQNQGFYLNPENSNPTQGLIYGSISLPLVQGLFIDERRTALKQAKIFREATFSEQQLLLNELLFNAGKAYWDWFAAYNNVKVFEDAYDAALVRFNAVKQSALLGDRPFVDTLEAGIQLQERQLSLQQAKLEFVNHTLFLSTFLWLENGTPLELRENAVPSLYSAIEVNEKEMLPFLLKLDSLNETHPLVALSQYNISWLEAERRWKIEKLKPALNVNYNALTLPFGSSAENNYSINNYKWGLEFSMPVLLRRERGDLQLTRLKLTEARLDLQNKTLELLNKAKAALNEHETSVSQVRLYTATVRDYDDLLEAEKRKFGMGESSLFMINAREVSAISAKQKLIDLLLKNRKAVLAVQHAFGELGL